MGRTYYSKNRPKKTFDLNIAGTQILDEIHSEIGVGCFVTGEGFPWERKMVKFIFPKELSKESAKALKNMSDESIKKIYKLVNKKLWDGSLDEFKIFINDWANFLEKSNGCEAL